MKTKNQIILDPYPQPIDRIFTSEAYRRLNDLVDIKTNGDQRMAAEEFDSHLPEAAALIGQAAMPKERLDQAPKLRAIFNVEGNFYQNIDYAECFRRNIRVLNCGGVYARPLAEMALAMAIDLARGITWEHQRFQAGTERYIQEGNQDSVLLTGSSVGLIGFGLLGKSLKPLLDPFRCTIKAYDPWLPESLLREHDCIPATLEDLLATSRFIFVLAGVTSENQGFLGREELNLIQPGSFFLLMSRAAVVDFDELVSQVAAGRFKAATDVFPSEPMPKDHPIRQVPNFVLSPHRAGGMPQAYHAIGDMVVDDLALVLRGLPPVRMQSAMPEIISKLSSKPAFD